MISSTTSSFQNLYGKFIRTSAQAFLNPILTPYLLRHLCLYEMVRMQEAECWEWSRAREYGII